MTGNLLETLDQWEMNMIAEFLSSFDVILMQATCSCVRDCLQTIAAVSQGKKDNHNLNWLLARSTRNNHRDLCVLALEWAYGTQLESYPTTGAPGREERQ